MRVDGSSGRSLRVIALSATLALIAGVLSALPARAADPVTLNLLTMNDFHGRIAPGLTIPFAATVQKLRAEGGADNTLLVSAGDNVSASLFASAVQDDQPTIDVLNALGVDASAVGNHEFDKGYDDLVNRIVGTGPNAKWPYLGANVYRKGTTTPALPEYAIIERAGLTVGIIGAVTEETSTLVSPAGIAALDFGDPVPAVNRVAAQLTDGNAANGEADILVAAYHEGVDGITKDTTLDQALAKSPVFAEIVNQTSPKVAAIVTAHTHQVYAFRAPVPGSSATRPVIQTGNYGDNVGQIKLSIDPDTKTVTTYTVSNVPRIVTRDANHPTAPTDADLVDANPGLGPINTIVQDALAYADKEGNKPVGTITADITTAYLDGKRDDRGSESTLGNTVANALRDKLAAADLGGAEIGVVNPGGLRSELFYAGTAGNSADADGRVLYAEANAVLPFVNNLWTTSLTGAQFVTMLEQQWQRAAAGGTPPSRDFLNLGLSDNVSYTYHEVDDPATAGKKKGIIDSVTISGKPLDPSASYRIGTFSFLTSGGDNFRVLGQGTNARDTGLIDRDVWIAYLKENPGLAPSFARRAVRVSDQPTVVDSGAQVSFGLSKLDLTSLGSPKNTSVAVSLKSASGAESAVGSFPVTDGATTITMTAPAAGSYTLVAKATPSGTTVQFPLTVRAVVRATAVSLATERERVVIKVTATNLDAVPVDLTLSTQWGEASFEDVAPGRTVTKRFRTKQRSVPAGEATVTARKTVDGQPRTSTTTVAYEGLIATVDPRGYVQTTIARDRAGEVVLTAYFVNLGGDPVTASLSTPYGNSSIKTVRPLRTGVFTVATGEARLRTRTEGTVTATKTIDGRTFTQRFAANFPRLR